MRSVLVTPRWIGLHLLAVLAVAVCLGMGYWQFVRAQEPERDRVTNPVEELAAARPIGEVLQPGAYMPEAEGNQAVTATGVYDADARLLAPALSPEGDRGYYVIVPLVTADDTALTVSLGWVPEARADSLDRLPAPPEGEVTVTGWLMPPDKAEDGYVPMETPDGYAARIAPSVLVNEWPYRLYEGYVIRGAQDPADTGGGAGLREIPPPEPPQGVVWNWRNVSYAAQWAVFGGAVVVFWISLMRREVQDRRERAAGAGDGGGPGDGPGGGGAPPRPGADTTGPAAEAAEAPGDQVSVARTS
ncbi:SURF1 family protein [Streptomonospora nanhaiensis]|uniref:SURF1-like protein n=1 Tax=Streptomonospora nanhaiensis TaxID=1323731 RepID=A0A853BPX3_9ACTN|nr:SURF1 family protein [Streptomonospora nanhaiensis]MBV2365087.1 SURF1 family protein [Streptomonospora nanhaiensis]MBX9389999.1 SURF1 family protein [Streptomonospora nanhaiensis]NYI96706.1 cytochrome oxidase assembly protein ShyY1 [Streptomonospora nanhaiensis]